MILTEITKNILNYFGCEGAEITEQEIDGRIIVDIKATNGRDLVGEKGATLLVLQHIIRRIASKQISPSIVVDIDVNGYKKMRESILRDFALDVGNKVRINKKSVELEPMPSTDRRIIHLTLASFSDITTESAGEGFSRYVIVRPYP
ncbi:MAG: hypothetical protein A3B96_02465 [Candidatus Spechtbacteria bacterium RIFCSPHIGHO2_02_FULL_43_15b]|uniref:R3H domain-containing protein n=1 Tax=Candidatus Spechtbacteria bacterium RIFCSPHIGHO2_01_FULL_43_30 TaxID=1802158 RepID=A0A1G2H6J3_9BACT|nr:MAG: hypothetical protein A2827_02620 [Candidatus Spechtbacteria bacterium RIFCSPHIGHO2_01_FULL_43_30]OGZ60164.1 MAG: hypothetical protein A3B96_02465 [Candidatus Spechtbacteria bacterium RIFCSPHIGHO2_02_FULL_43_15b]